jgi:ATP synthase protein I
MEIACELRQSGCMRQDIKHGVVHFYIAQLIIILIAGLLAFCLGNLHALISAILGGLVCFVPGLLFAIYFFRYKGAQQTSKIVSAFYLGEVFKLILTGVLFVVVFINYKINPSAFFITFIAVQMLYWLAPWLIVKK